MIKNFYQKNQYLNIQVLKMDGVFKSKYGIWNISFLKGFWGQEIRFEVANPGPEEPTIRLLNFDFEILMLILGEI
ncbi:hypothetical protein BpHYR1_009131 [Brachionus plicatilis]|uniref:Uncharacterized protein n=1 Tax=Brachionus plicatilis TaxID=10195 RepID=A0A3M7SG71_BRAPC|nr:hypothetical protein BpHYR1_009131 [Brachionus plicatilis]